MANVLEVRRRYRRLVTCQLPVLGGVAVLSLLGLVWFVASNSQVAVTGPLQVDIKFTHDATRLIHDHIPETCAGLTVRGVAINGSLGNPTVSSINDARCPLNQAEVPAEAGTVVPVVPSK